MTKIFTFILAIFTAGLIGCSDAGLTTGGAQDINNFRENIKNDFLPHPSSLTYEGLFSDYFFNMGQGELCEQMFCPVYASALSKDPFSQQDEYFLSVGFNSSSQGEEFTRKRLNLVIVLDISRSMYGLWDQYYYDHSSKEEREHREWSRTKMEVASESVISLLNHLKQEDSLGMVLFESKAYVEQHLKEVRGIDMKSLERYLTYLNPRGRTNLFAGMSRASELFKGVADIDNVEVENRIIFLTDAQPNMGELGEGELARLVKSNAEKKIYTTFVGIGVDFNTELVELMTKVSKTKNYGFSSTSRGWRISPS